MRNAFRLSATVTRFAVAHLALYRSQDQTWLSQGIDEEVREDRRRNNAIASDVDESQCKSQGPGRQCGSVAETVPAGGAKEAVSY
jgi:hypothetical protein